MRAFFCPIFVPRTLFIERKGVGDMRVRLFILANACRLLYRAWKVYRKQPKAYRKRLKTYRKRLKTAENNHAYDINSQ